MRTNHNTPFPVKTLLDDIHRVVRHPKYLQDPQSFHLFSLLLKQNKFFRNKLDETTNLHDFIELAKHHIRYEVHRYGSLILKENDYADKFYIIIKGNTQKIQQKSYQSFRKLTGHLPTFNSPLERSESPKNISPSPSRKSFKLKTIVKAIGAFSPIKSIPIQSCLSNSSTSTDLDMEVIQPLQALQPARSFRKSRTVLNNNSRRSPSPKQNGFTLTSILQTDRSRQAPNNNSPSLKSSSLHDISPEASPTVRFAINNQRVSPISLTKLTKKITIEHSQELKEEPEKEDFSHENTQREPKIHENEEDFMKFLAEKNPSLHNKFILYDVPRAEVTKTYQPGDYFGENFSKEQQSRETAMIAVSSPEVHVLTLSRENYNQILGELKCQAAERADFFSKMFPSYNKELLERFSRYFNLNKFKKGEQIYKQGEAAQQLYLLRAGDVGLSREELRIIPVKPEQSLTVSLTNLTARRYGEKVDLMVASITKNQFFGEEYLLKKDKREYSAIVRASETLAYSLDFSEYRAIREEYAPLFEGFKEQAQERFKWREQRVTSLMKRPTVFVEPLVTDRERKGEETSGTDLSSARMKESLQDLEFIKQASEKRTSKFFLKTLKEIVENPPSPTKGIWTKKFSRKPVTQIDTKGEFSERNETVEPIGSANELMEFNIRKELEEVSATTRKSRVVLSPLRPRRITKGPEMGQSNQYTKSKKQVSLEPMARNDPVYSLSNVNLKTFGVLDASTEYFENSSPLLPQSIKLKRLLKPEEKLVESSGLFSKISVENVSVRSERKLVTYNELGGVVKMMKKGRKKQENMMSLKMKMKEICKLNIRKENVTMYS